MSDPTIVTGDALRRLDPFEGTWKASIKHWFQPGGDPIRSTGVMTKSWILGRKFLMQDYRSDSGDFEGRGYWGCNAVTGRYEIFWVDSMCSGMEVQVGDYDEATKSWTMVGQVDNPMSGGRMTKRSVITLRDDGTYVMTMYLPGPDGAEMKVMESVQTRA